MTIVQAAASAFWILAVIHACQSERQCRVHTDAKIADFHQSLICTVGHCAPFYLKCSKDGSFCATIQCESGSCFNATTQQCTQQTKCMIDYVQQIEHHKLCLINDGTVRGFSLNGPHSSDYALCDERNTLWLLSCSEEETYDEQRNKCIRKEQDMHMVHLTKFCQNSIRKGSYPLGKCQRLIVNCDKQKIERCPEEKVASFDGRCVDNQRFGCPTHPHDKEQALKILAKKANVCRHTNSTSLMIYDLGSIREGFILCLMNSDGKHSYEARLCNEGDKMTIGSNIYCERAGNHWQNKGNQLFQLIYRDICNKKGPVLRQLIDDVDGSLYLDCKPDHTHKISVKDCGIDLVFVESQQRCANPNTDNCGLKANDGVAAGIADNCGRDYKVCISGRKFWLKCPQADHVRCGRDGCVHREHCPACQPYTPTYPTTKSTHPHFTIAPPTTEAPTTPHDFNDCHSTGSYTAHPTDCAKYLVCEHSRWRSMPCAPGTLFNKHIGVCDHKRNVNCHHSQQQEQRQGQQVIETETDEVPLDQSDEQPFVRVDDQDI